MDHEVLIIGGGVIGLSIARELHKKGVRRIALIDKGTCGGEASWAAAGMLGPQAEADEPSAFFDLCCAARDLYPQFAAAILDETDIDIELDREGTLHLAFTGDDARQLEKRYEWQSAAGLPVEFLSAADARKAEPFVSPDVTAALYFPGDWQVENRRLCEALKSYCQTSGIDVRENYLVESLIVDAGRVIGAETATGRITADKTLLATGAWTSLIKLGANPMPLNITPVRGQMITFHTAKRLFKRVIYGPYGYIVPRTDGRILAGSTTEKVGFDISVTGTAARDLQAMACEIAPGVRNLDITGHWAGLRPFAADGLPVLGHVDGIDGLFIATAHYRNGILLAPLTARLMADSITGGKDAAGYFETFGTGRFRLSGVGAGV